METPLFCESLTKEYGEKRAVDSVTMNLERGSVLALVGPNGAGKTTWIKLVSGLLPPTSGTAKICGIDIQENPRQAHEKIGYLPDFFGLYDDLSAEEYLSYFAYCYGVEKCKHKTRIAETLEFLSLSDLAQKQIRFLSRGQKQRVAIGRAILHDPELLLLDEPAAGLDPEARSEFNSLIKKLARSGKTIVVSSHILSELEEYSTHVAIFGDGKLIRFGQLGELAGRVEVSQRKIRIRIKEGAEELSRFLKNKGFQFEEDLNKDFWIDFTAASDLNGAAALLLKEIVNKQIKIFHFELIEKRVEDIYLNTVKASRKQENKNA